MNHLIAITLCLAATAQIAARIEGVVRDRDGSPIRGARVTAALVRGIGERVIAPRSAASMEGRLRSAETDSTGAFRIEVDEAGSYNMLVQADGYIPPSPLDGGRFLLVSEATGSGEPVVHRVNLILDRPATVTAILLDGDSKEAIGNHPIELQHARYFRGGMTLLPLGRAATSPEGRLLFENIPPGDYYLQMQPSISESMAHMSDKMPSEESARAHGYIRAFLPEFTDPAHALPIRINSGAHVDLGSFGVMKQAFYRISGTIEFARCENGGQYHLSLSQRYGGGEVARATAALPCGTAFVIDNVGVGRYNLVAFSLGGETRQREIVRLPIEVVDRDLQINEQARPPLQLSGSIRLPEQASRQASAKLRVRIMPIGALPLWEGVPVEVDGKGRFSLVWSQRVQGLLSVEGLDAPYYVKSVSYNGSLARGSVLAPDPFAAEQRIEVVVCDRPATISGQVKVKGEPEPGAMVMIAPWPLELMGGYPVFASTVTDEGGRFSVQGFPAGKYRVVALHYSVRRQVQRSDVAVSALSAGSEVDVGEGGTQLLALDLSSIR